MVVIFKSRKASQKNIPSNFEPHKCPVDRNLNSNFPLKIQKYCTSKNTIKTLIIKTTNFISKQFLNIFAICHRTKNYHFSFTQQFIQLIEFVWFLHNFSCFRFTSSFVLTHSFRLDRQQQQIAAVENMINAKHRVEAKNEWEREAEKSEQVQSSSNRVAQCTC